MASSSSNHNLFPLFEWSSSWTLRSHSLKDFRSWSLRAYFSLSNQTNENYNSHLLSFREWGILATYPFIHLYTFNPLGTFPDDLLYFLWYLCHLYHISIEIPTKFFWDQFKNLGPYTLNLNKFFKWFKSTSQWMQTLKAKLQNFPNVDGRWTEIESTNRPRRIISQWISNIYTILIFHCPFHPLENMMSVNRCPKATAYKTYSFFLQTR